jgi:CxxC-x17-CxxC domain-containing protein
MKKFNQGRDRDFGDRGPRRSSGGFDRGPSRRPERGGFGGGNRGGASTMHQAVCFECGKDCEVPFRPTGGKPVFCSACFDKKGGSESRVRGGFDGRPERSFERDNSFKPRFDDRKFGDNKKPFNDGKLDEVIAKLDKVIRLLTPVVDLKKEEPKMTEVRVVNKEAEVKAKVAPKKKVEKKISTKTGPKAKAKAKTKK